ncbi:hypothetical protein PC129_g759 [Phytophthora cactorum]|uniref:Uncharacterized protein n=1 Tax=Phytophthora cactorum TaxID=29920 RepID=A0A8T1ELB6_9STRA|nr:hypothetical protein Pcac1_g260 [Phytophthora cactorum]KAG2934961.1 hypothetical protein PC114_g818 [Phytophthora cactorum]KAG2955916.1 hypothetical protein PC117_g88 [Phytophthora cactorum]KAG3036313.1 hypothetical protein PC120_g347 [Phytophthora cactorum]KAG3042188.1 hypothetical protein PC119_g311 [Phytophthora cactorum]
MLGVNRGNALAAEICKAVASGVWSAWFFCVFATRESAWSSHRHSRTGSAGGLSAAPQALAMPVLIKCHAVKGLSGRCIDAA